MKALVLKAALPLVVAGAIEVLFLRLLMRTGNYLPRAADLMDFYRALLHGGTTAANLVAILTLALLALYGATLLREAGRWNWLAAGAVWSALLSQAWLTLTAGTSAAEAVLSQLCTAIALVAVFATSAARGGRRLLHGTVLASQLLALYYAIAQPASSLGLVLPGALGSYFVAEALAVLAGSLVMVAAGTPPRRGPIIAGSVVGGLVLLGVTFMPSAFHLATMWTVAFTLFMPGPVYAVAAGLFVYGVTLCWRRPAGRVVSAAGLLLIAFGGLKLDYGYFVLLSLAGSVLLAAESRFAAVASQQPAPAAVAAGSVNRAATTASTI